MVYRYQCRKAVIIKTERHHQFEIETFVFKGNFLMDSLLNIFLHQDDL